MLHITSAHPSTSLPLFTTDNISLYYLLCYIPPAHPFLSGTPTLGPPISNTTIISAHPSPFYPIPGPIRLYLTLYPLLITTVTLNIIYITFYTPYPWPSPFHRLHTTHSAHSYIMLQLLPSAHVGWPVTQGTLSPSAGRLRRVSSLNGLRVTCSRLVRVTTRSNRRNVNSICLRG